MSDSVLKLENVSIFQNDNLVLSDVNVDVKEGDFVKEGDTIMFISEIKSDYFDPKLIDRTSNQIENKNNSWKQLHSLPLKYSTIYFSKLLMIITIM